MTIFLNLKAMESMLEKTKTLDDSSSQTTDSTHLSPNYKQNIHTRAERKDIRSVSKSVDRSKSTNKQTLPEYIKSNIEDNFMYTQKSTLPVKAQNIKLEDSTRQSTLPVDTQNKKLVGVIKKSTLPVNTQNIELIDYVHPTIYAQSTIFNTPPKSSTQSSQQTSPQQTSPYQSLQSPYQQLHISSFPTPPNNSILSWISHESILTFPNLESFEYQIACFEEQVKNFFISEVKPDFETTIKVPKCKLRIMENFIDYNITKYQHIMKEEEQMRFVEESQLEEKIANKDRYTINNACCRCGQMVRDQSMCINNNSEINKEKQAEEKYNNMMKKCDVLNDYIANIVPKYDSKRYNYKLLPVIVRANYVKDTFIPREIVQDIIIIVQTPCFVPVSKEIFAKMQKMNNQDKL